MKYAFFLGAGASKTCQAPLQGEILKHYFTHRRQQENLYNDENLEDMYISRFLNQLFGLDIENDNIETVSFPTFEEILGIIDLAIMRKDSFPNLENDFQLFGDEDSLYAFRDRFIGLIAVILRDKLSNVYNNHELLLANLDRKNVLRKTIFLSTNYDILIDNALLRQNHAINYAFKLYNVKQGQIRVPLYKLHGSLNWLYCPTCKIINITPFKKGAVMYYDLREPRLLSCQYCNSKKKPIIVPPTYFKDFSNFHLNKVWHEAEQALKSIDTIFFCGYSFPDADIHIKYLLKRAEIIRNGRALNVVVVNNHERKSDYEKAIEKERFSRFFRHGQVSYTDSSFEDLIENIDAHL